MYGSGPLRLSMTLCPYHYSLTSYCSSGPKMSPGWADWHNIETSEACAIRQLGEMILGGRRPNCENAPSCTAMIAIEPLTTHLSMVPVLILHLQRIVNVKTLVRW